MLDEDKACFDSSNVLVTLEPKKDMSEYYQDLVVKSLENLKDIEDDMFESEWEEIESDDSSKDTYITGKRYVTLINNMNELLNNMDLSELKEKDMMYSGQ